MSKATFKMILRCLHPDSRDTVSGERLREAFIAFRDLEKLLLNEKDSPIEFVKIPQTREEWEALRKKKKSPASTNTSAPCP